jgi:hypothetical protein
VTCSQCSRSFEGGTCPYCGTPVPLVIYDSPVPDTSPWWSRPTDFVGWKYRIALFLFICFGAVWTVKKLGRSLSILAGVLALAVLALVIWFRYRNDEL